MKPLWAVRDKTLNATYFVGNFFRLKSSIITENTKLKEEIFGLRLNKIDYEFLLKENEDLKNILGEDKIKNRTASRVLAKPPQSPFDTFVVDKGLSSGIELGDKVYISNNIIIGLISNLTSSSGVVKLFSSGDEEIQAISSRTGASFTLVGSGGANFKFEVPRDTDVLWGDSFVYSEVSNSVLATVYYIDSNSQSSFKTVYLKIPGNVFEVRTVFIGK